MAGLLTLAEFNLNELPFASIAIPFLGVLLITIGMMMGIRGKRRRASARGSARDRVDELRQKQAVRGDLEQLMAEVEQLAKRFGTQLDAKTMHMERLLDEADRKIAELKQLEQTRQHAMMLQASAPAHYTPPPSPSPEPPALAPAEHNPPPVAHPPAPSPDEALKRSVCALADRGVDTVEIAKQLNEHVGKVELILALRKA